MWLLGCPPEAGPAGIALHPHHSPPLAYLAMAGAAHSCVGYAAIRPLTTACACHSFRGFFAKRFYEGGFEDPMTRREAALILGCRENASKERVLERYRKLMR